MYTYIHKYIYVYICIYIYIYIVGTLLNLKNPKSVWIRIIYPDVIPTDPSGFYQILGDMDSIWVSQLIKDDEVI